MDIMNKYDDDMRKLHEHMEDIRQYIVEKNLPGAKEAAAYVQHINEPILHMEHILANSNVYDILKEYNLDPAIQKYLLLYKTYFYLKFHTIILDLDYDFEFLNLKISDVVLREEPAYMERARQILQKFARDDQRFEAMIKRSKQRIARDRAKNQL